MFFVNLKKHCFNIFCVKYFFTRFLGENVSGEYVVQPCSGLMFVVQLVA